MQVLRASKLGILFTSLLLQSCSFEPPQLTNPVTWYAVNGWYSPVELQIYDRVCGRPLRSIRLDVREEIAVTSCGNAQNRAVIRYRRDSYQMAWSEGTAGNGQRLQMQ